ncbi:MAG: hypothetical protein ACJAWL_003693, partial [Motiliproteus sp.]
PRHSNIPVHQKRPLLNRPAGTRLRRYEIQPEADRFGILPQLPVSPLRAFLVCISSV